MDTYYSMSTKVIEWRVTHQFHDRRCLQVGLESSSVKILALSITWFFFEKLSHLGGASWAAILLVASYPVNCRVGSVKEAVPQKLKGQGRALPPFPSLPSLLSLRPYSAVKPCPFSLCPPIPPPSALDPRDFQPPAPTWLAFTVGLLNSVLAGPLALHHLDSPTVTKLPALTCNLPRPGVEQERWNKGVPHLPLQRESKDGTDGT